MFLLQTVSNTALMVNEPANPRCRLGGDVFSHFQTYFSLFS